MRLVKITILNILIQVYKKRIPKSCAGHCPHTTLPPSIPAPTHQLTTLDDTSRGIPRNTLYQYQNQYYTQYLQAFMYIY
jgi:hypothetical protein